MNQLNDISDEDFIPFLHSLGVDTYKKSFEWLLNDPDFAGVLRWMYGNLDENNALTAREDYRYLELEKKQKLLTPEDLDSQIKHIQDQFHGICLPGDKVNSDNIKMDTTMQKERLAMLTKQGNILQDLTSKNEQIKEDITVELTHLNAALQQCSEDESTTAEECEKLAEDVENMTDSIMDVISDALDQYTNTQTDKEMSQKFFTFGPFESYRQSQALFRSHCDLYTTKKFNKRQNDNISVEELQNVLAEARSLEERLTAAVYAYIESQAELSGEQAKLALVANYTPVHPSQITIATMEAQSALELLEQEEGITTQQLQAAIKQLVDGRTKMAVNTTVKAAMAVREQIQQELVYLHDVCLQALCVDRALYSALRYELRTIEELLQFAAQLWGHASDERTAVAKRIELMNEICSEQESCDIKLQDSDPLLQILCKILNIPLTNDGTVIIKALIELRNTLKKIKEEIQDEYKKSGNNLPVLAARFLRSAITAPASAPLLSTLTYSLTATIKQTDRSILHATDTFTSIKKGDKQNLRKLWQWFLTDQQRLIAATSVAKILLNSLSLLTGFVVRTRPQLGGCWLGYASRSDPRGALPSWLVNKVTAQLAPRLVQQLQAAARKYPGWKALTDSPYYKPWRHPEQVPPYRISLEDCIDPDAPPVPPQNTDQKPVSSKSKLFVPQAKEIESHSVEDLGDISSEFSVEVEEETIDQPDPKRKGKFYKLVKSMKNRRKSVQVAKSADNLMENKPDEKLEKKKPFKFHRRFSMSRGKED